MDLAQPCQPRIKLRQSAFKHLAVTRVLDGLELLEDVPARQLNRLPLLLPDRLFRRKSLFRLDLEAGSRLLLLHGLAFPSARHLLQL